MPHSGWSRRAPGQGPQVRVERQHQPSHISALSPGMASATASRPSQVLRRLASAWILCSVCALHSLASLQGLPCRVCWLVKKWGSGCGSGVGHSLGRDRGVGPAGASEGFKHRKQNLPGYGPWTGAQSSKPQKVRAPGWVCHSQEAQQPARGTRPLHPVSL